MNAVEIEEAVSALALAPFDRAEFPFAFLTAFGNKATTIQRLRAGNTNQSDIAGGVLQRSQIHLATCDIGKVSDTFAALRASPRNGKAKPKFILATDGVDLEAEEVATGEVIACKHADIADHFGFFLPLAGISTVAEIKNNPIDIKATSRLNKLYLALLAENPDWGTAARRQELNQFMARLIFCFFAEDTGIFNHQGMFTACIKQMTAPDSSNTHDVIAELFRVMDTRPEDRNDTNAKKWAREFPYVNGGLFTHTVDCPRFSKIARTYLIRAGELDWKQINPDIFGSMIQAVADDDERGDLGMHYTSVPNILKVLDPLFLDDLREELEKAEDNPRKLLNLRKRIAAIRVFDPACGSGNFLVIAYIKMREIEAEIVRRRREHGDKAAQKTWIKLTNFYGIEIKSFAAEVARLSLLIAEFQCNVRLIGQREACLDVLPLHDSGRIRNDNALRVDWLEVCPPPEQRGPVEKDLGGPTGRLALNSDTPNVETYICGNPPYRGSSWQTKDQKEDLFIVANSEVPSWKSLDYVAAWVIKASRYIIAASGKFSFVATKSICEGEQAPILWPLLFRKNLTLLFAVTPFKWANLASHKAGVTVVVIGVGQASAEQTKHIYDGEIRRAVNVIGPYLAPGSEAVITRANASLGAQSAMLRGNMPTDGGHFIMSSDEAGSVLSSGTVPADMIKQYMGANEVINGIFRYCIWIEQNQIDAANSIPFVRHRIEQVRRTRLASSAPTTKNTKVPPHRFMQIEGTARRYSIAVPAITSENRQYLPVTLLSSRVILSNKCYALYDAPLWNMAFVASRLHLVWIGTVCARMRNDFSYSNTLGWNTFPVPPLTENQKADLTRCAEDILLAREQYWPATIADMYDPDRMDKEFPLVRQAHERNDETLERIYIGRRFRNDTERLEKLFDMYTKMTTAEVAKAPKQNGRKSKSNESPSA